MRRCAPFEPLTACADGGRGTRMADASGAAGGRYRAFISYSHRDAVFAARLHRRLEGYVLPKRLGAAGRRLTPIFKDREELPAAQDLSVQVRAALAASDCLVVACSPDAAASPWVGREIELFRELHPDRPILAALIRGEPAEAFPPALATGGIEPLAADFRKEADGERLALLKLVAGIAGVGVDQLVQRDAQRRLRGVTALTAASLAGVIAMGAMTTLALSARAEAERQRREAEGLVEFMLTDLRDRLEGVGRLDVLTAANQRALAYYSGRDLDRLPAESLERRARILMVMGEDDANRGDLASAVAQFTEARRVTAALLRSEPKNPDRIWAHGQSEFWLGYIAYLGKDTAAARRGFEAYRDLSLSLAAIDGDNPKFLAELAYANGNLCSLAIEQEKQVERALRSCREALALMRRAVGPTPATTEKGLDLANRHAWLSQAYEFAADHAAARREAETLEALLDRLLRRDPANVKLKDQWTGAQRSLARLDYRRGDYRSALMRARRCRDGLMALIALEPRNQRWRDQLASAEQSIAVIETARPKGKP
jgi:hypothetical protein